MSEPTPVENMQTLRDAIVERRRDLASDIIRQNKTDNEPLSGAEGRRSQIAAIQALIESLDGTIADEKTVKRPSSDIRWHLWEIIADFLTPLRCRRQAGRGFARASAS
jgi:hypothetical protein